MGDMVAQRVVLQRRAQMVALAEVADSNDGIGHCLDYISKAFLGGSEIDQTRGENHR